MIIFEQRDCPVCGGILTSLPSPSDPLGQKTFCVNTNCAAMWVGAFTPAETGVDEVWED